MKLFRELTRRGRLRRLRQLANTALSAYQLNGARLTFIQYGENAIYRVDCARPGSLPIIAEPFIPDRYVLRLHAMSDSAAIASELTWLAALSQQAGLHVPAPESTPDGRLLATITTPGMPKGRVISLMRWLNGRCYRKGLRPYHLAALGKVVAQMHNFSTSWQPPGGFTRPIWDWDAQLGGSLFHHPLEQVVDSIPSRFRSAFELISTQAKQVMSSFGKDSYAFGLIHGDLYPENVLFNGAEAFPIDFEDCGYGYWMGDIAVALCTWAWGSEWQRMRDAFWQGYSQYRSLPEAQCSQLDLFIAAQFATMVLWSSAFLVNDPNRAAEYLPWRDQSGNRLLSYFDR